MAHRALAEALTVVIRISYPLAQSKVVVVKAELLVALAALAAHTLATVVVTVALVEIGQTIHPNRTPVAAAVALAATLVMAVMAVTQAMAVVSQALVALVAVAAVALLATTQGPVLVTLAQAEAVALVYWAKAQAEMAALADLIQQAIIQLKLLVRVALAEQTAAEVVLALMVEDMVAEALQTAMQVGQQ